MTPRVPSFLYAGAAKAGSFWIYEVLREHPEVFVPDVKDIMFFERSYSLGWDWYLSHFARATNEKVAGELSHDYFLEREYAERIRHHLPDVKLLFCLREGVERTYSEYLYDRTIFQYATAAQYRHGFTFEQFATLGVIEHLSDYYRNLLPFYELFPPEQILVLFFDNLKEDNASFARRIFEFLSVDADFVPSLLDKKVNAARKARAPRVAEAVYRAGALLRRMGMASTVGSLKRRSWFEWLLYRPMDSRREAEPLRPDVVLRLRERYHKDYTRLAELIGKPLPSTWTAPPSAPAAE